MYACNILKTVRMCSLEFSENNTKQLHLVEQLGSVERELVLLTFLKYWRKICGFVEKSPFFVENYSFGKNRSFRWKIAVLVKIEVSGGKWPFW